MVAGPVIPPTGILVHVGGQDTSLHQRFVTLADLRRWEPTFAVKHVQIFSTRRPSRTEANFTTLDDGTHVEFQDGRLSIRATSIKAALAAYAWAFGSSTELDVQVRRTARG